MQFQKQLSVTIFICANNLRRNKNCERQCHPDVSFSCLNSLYFTVHIFSSHQSLQSALNKLYFYLTIKRRNKLFLFCYVTFDLQILLARLLSAIGNNIDKLPALKISQEYMYIGGKKKKKTYFALIFLHFAVTIASTIHVTNA